MYFVSLTLSLSLSNVWIKNSNIKLNRSITSYNQLDFNLVVQSLSHSSDRRKVGIQIPLNSCIGVCAH